MPPSAIVLGAGMVGVSVALHLRRRGRRRRAGGPAGRRARARSFGNGGLIQREAVYPAPLPARRSRNCARIARNRAVDVALPSARTCRASPRRCCSTGGTRNRAATPRAVAGLCALIATCLDEHLAFAQPAPTAMALLRPIGWMRLYGEPRLLDAALSQAEVARRDHGVNFAPLDGDGPGGGRTASAWCERARCHPLDRPPLGQRSARADARLRQAVRGRGRHASPSATPLTLQRAASGWRRPARGRRGGGGGGRRRPRRRMRCSVTKRAGLCAAAVRQARLPHALRAARQCHAEPPRAGHRQRLPAGADARGHPPDHRRRIRPPRRAADARSSSSAPSPSRAACCRWRSGWRPTPWMGVRPCTPDMLPIIGRMPGQHGAWCAFGHAHQGLTLGPTTGRLLAEMMSGETPFVSPEPYQPARF